MAEHQAAAEHGAGVIGQGAHRQTGQQAEYSIQGSDDSTGEKSGKRIAGNGELRHDPLRTGLSMRKDPIEELLQLMRKEAVQEKVRDDQIVLTDGPDGPDRPAGLPFETIREVQADFLPTGAANAAFEYCEHGPAGVDYIRMKTRIDSQQVLQKAPVPIA